MKLQSILSAMEAYDPDCICRCENPACELDGTVLGMGNDIPGQLHLYIGVVPEGAPGTDTESCCLCLKGFIPTKVSNLIAVSDESELTEVFNRIQTWLSKMQELLRLSQQKMSRGLELREIVDRATKILDNPMLVADPSHKILAMSDVELDDSAWKNFREMGQVPYHPDMAQEYDRFLQGIKEGEYVNLVDGLHKKGYFIRCAVMNRSMMVAQMHIFSEFHEFDAIDLELARVLSGIIAMDVMQHTILQDEGWTSCDYFISDLIRGKLTETAAIEARLKYVGWKLKRIKYLLLVRWDGAGENIDYRDACMATLNSIFADGRSVMDGPNMVILFGVDQELSIHSPQVEEVCAYLERSGLRGVFSLPFEDLRDAAYRYQQSREILDLNKELRREDQLIMADASSFELLIHQAGQKYRLMDYCHPLVRQLKDYDEREGKDYLDTLKAYIFAGRSYTKAAELLHMHRNSVIYRMKQIEEILNFDFSKEEFVFHLELSFRILDYIKAEREGKWEKRRET